jgi:ubiquitin-like protein Pup
MEVSGPWLSRRRTPAQGRLPTQREEGGVGTSQLPKKGERIREELDKLLDELDDLLEENAEEFVASYVQRGGQ